MMSNIDYEIKEEVGILSRRGNITVEVNLVSWGGRDVTCDIRKWSNAYGVKVPQKGICLTPGELKQLRDLIPKVKTGNETDGEKYE